MNAIKLKGLQVFTEDSARRLRGNHCVYDGDTDPYQHPLPEEQIVNYKSDPDSFPGQRFAANNNFICYALNSGKIRIISNRTSTRYLLFCPERVADMKFFSADVDLLASISVGGYLYVWRIVEREEEIQGHKVMEAIISGGSEFILSRVCWHCSKQEILVVGIGKSVLRINTQKVGNFENNWLGTPTVSRLDPGVHFVGDHIGEINDLSMCRRKKTVLLVTASNDGTIKIWNEANALPIAQLIPHNGEAVTSAKFITFPKHPEDIVLVTGSSSSAEVKIWTSVGSLWHCTQTLKLKNSSRPDDLVFNQILFIPHPGLLVLANNKINTIYTIELKYDIYPSMNYVTQFIVTMPILSLTGTSDLSHGGDRIIRIYCIMTEAVNRYVLDLSCCCAPFSSSLAPHAPSRKHVQQLKDVKKILNELMIMQKGTQNYISKGSVQENIRNQVREPGLEEQDLADVLPDLALTLAPTVEETVFTAITEAFKDIVEIVSSVPQTLSSEVVDDRGKLLALGDGGASSSSANQLIRQQKYAAIGGLPDEIEGPRDPPNKLCIFICDKKYEEAFTIALQRSDVSVVSWLCAQVDLSSILLMKTLPLSQGVLLLLLEQLAFDINNDISRKLVWMRDVAMVINPADMMIAQHVRPVLEQVYDILNNQMNLPNTF